MQNNLHQFKQKFKPLAEALDADNGFLSKTCRLQLAVSQSGCRSYAAWFLNPVRPSVWMGDKLEKWLLL